MPGYYPTWQPSQTVGSAANLEYGGRYTRTGWPTGQTSVEYVPDAQPSTAPYISPYLLRNETTPGGAPTNGHTADNYLSPFVPQEAVWYSPDARSSTRVAWDSGLYLRQDIDIGHSQIQAGPLFIDFTQIEADALYSDISGPYSKIVPSDGFIAAIGLYFNIDLRLSTRTFLTASGVAYYVPTSNRFGLYLLGGSNTYAHFEHSFEWGRWDVTVFDYLDVLTPLSYLLQNAATSPAYDRSGLYTLGFLTSGFDHPFDSDLLYIRNTVGIRGATFLGPDVRLSTGYEHYDDWFGGNLHHLANLDHYYAGVFYEPKDWWFMPWATYDAYFFDNYGSSLQQVYVGATMPFSPSLSAYARVGWAWLGGHAGRGIDDGNLVWDVGVNHRISPSWTESLAVGNSYRISPLLATTSGLYATYTISFTPPESRFFASGSVTYAHIEPQSETDWLATVMAGMNIDEYTSIRGIVMYSPSDWDSGNRSIWMYRAELDRILTPTVNLRLIYQYTDYETTQFNSSYRDQLIMLSITKAL